MSGVAAGVLRHWVSLEQPITTQNPVTGEEGVTWETVANTWAQIVPMSAREFVAAAAEQSEVRGRIVLRWRGDIDATWRVTYNGKWYAIFGVMEDADSMTEHVTLAVGEGVRLDQ